MTAIAGQATDHAGRPLPDAKGDLYVDTPSGMMAPWPSAPWTTTISRTDATFRIAPVPVGLPYSDLLTWHDQQANVALKDLAPGQERRLGQIVLHDPGAATRPANPGLRLPPPEPWDRSITGRILTEGDKPLAGAGVGILFTPPNSGRTLILDNDIVTDLKGRFKAEGLPRTGPLQISTRVPDVGKEATWTVTATPGPLVLRLSAADPPATAPAGAAPPPVPPPAPVPIDLP
jgi:hypothetical protein